MHPVTAAAQLHVNPTAVQVKLKPESKLRDKVAALVASAQSSAENRIKDIDRQRQEDMQIIANRFNKQKDLFQTETTAPPPIVTAPPAVSKVVRPMPPPPPPPMGVANASSKRRSRKTLKLRISYIELLPIFHLHFTAGDVAIDEESKRARKSHQDRLYPALSDLESSDDNCCATTATASVNDDDTEEELERCADKCYSCLLFLLCIE